MSGNWKSVRPSQLCRSFLRAGSQNTQRAYAIDLRQFREFVGVKTDVEAVRRFCDMSAGAAARTLRDFQGWLRGRGYSANTVRRRISSMLSLAAMAKQYDVIQWSVRIQLPRASLTRDTRGPTRQQIEEMIEVCEDRGDAKGARDKAIVELLFFCALRSSELLSIDLEHYDRPHCLVSVRAKARWDRETVFIPLRVRDSIDEWLEHRGEDDGPMFVSFNASARASRQRLTYRGLYDLVSRLGREVGIRCRPHGLRHAGITEALRLLNGDILQVMSFSRHRDPRTILAYVDALEDRGRSVAEIVADGRPFRG